MPTAKKRLSRPVAMRHLAHVDTAGDELGARCLDVRHDEIEARRRARHGRRDAGAEVDRARRAWRRELHDPKRVAHDEVGVDPPAQAAVEALGALDVGYRDDDDLEPHVASPGGACGLSLDHRFALTHDGLLACPRGGLGRSPSAMHPTCMPPAPAAS